MIYLFLVFIVISVAITVFKVNKHRSYEVITQSEYESYFNSLSDEEKLKHLRHKLDFRERCFKRWPQEDDEEWIESCLKNYGQKTNPHYDIEKGSIKRLKKQIKEIENRSNL